MSKKQEMVKTVRYVKYHSSRFGVSISNKLLNFFR